MSCCSPVFVKSRVTKRVKRSRSSRALSIPRQHLHTRIFPHLWSSAVPKLVLTAELHYGTESKAHVTMFELIWWHAIAGLNTNYHVSSDKSGGKKGWSFNKFIMKANDSYINQTASLRERLGRLNTEVTKVNSTVMTRTLVSFLLSSRDESVLQQCLVLPSPSPLAAMAFLAWPFATSKAV